MYDAILVLGRGVYQDGSIPESAKATIKEAVSLHQERKAKYVIVSGRWTYRLTYQPPATEAKAMAEYAIACGLSKEAILLEEQSTTTVENAYFVKKDLLIPREWHKILLVSVYPMAERAQYVMQFVFGPDYVCDLIEANFTFPADALKEKERSETSKMQIARDFYAANSLVAGDHERIFAVAREDLQKNWIGK